MIRYVECTSAAIQGLKSFTKNNPGHRNKEIQACIAKAAHFVETIQLPDGSWFTLLSIVVFSFNYYYQQNFNKIGGM